MVSSSFVVVVAVEKHLLLLELETKEEEEEEEEEEEGGQKKHVVIAKFLLLALLFCPLYAQKNKRLRKVFVVILSLFVFFLCVCYIRNSCNKISSTSTIQTYQSKQNTDRRVRKKHLRSQI